MQTQQTLIQQIESGGDIIDTLNKVSRGELSLPSSAKDIEAAANAISQAIVKKEVEFAISQQEAEILQKESETAESDGLFSRLFGDGKSMLEKQVKYGIEMQKLTNDRFRQVQELSKANMAFCQFLIGASGAMNAAMIKGLENAFKQEIQEIQNAFANVDSRVAGTEQAVLEMGGWIKNITQGLNEQAKVLTQTYKQARSQRKAIHKIFDFFRAIMAKLKG